MNDTLTSDLSGALKDKSHFEAEVDRFAKEVECLQEHNATLYSKNERDDGASTAKINWLNGELDMQKVRISNQREQIQRIDNMLGEEKRDRARLKRLVRDYESLISSLRRQVKELTEKAEYYKEHRNRYVDKFGALPRRCSNGAPLSNVSLAVECYE